MKYQWFCGCFQNVLILRTFAAYLKAVDGACWVEGLSFKIDKHPPAALALATAAVSFILHFLNFILTMLKVEHALQLWANGTITVEHVCLSQAKKALKIDFGAVVNDKGVESVAHAAFLSTLWGQQTKQYQSSVNKIPVLEMETIIEATSKFVKQGYM